MSFKVISFFSSVGHFVWLSGTVWANLEEGLMKEIRVKLLRNWARSAGDVVCKLFYIYSSGGHFVRRSQTVWTF